MFFSNKISGTDLEKTGQTYKRRGTFLFDSHSNRLFVQYRAIGATDALTPLTANILHMLNVDSSSTMLTHSQGGTSRRFST
jgi:hypothetical protein